MKPEVHVLGISIKTFGVTFALAFLACGLVIARRLRELEKPVDWAYEIVFAALLGGVIGARGYFLIQNYSTVKHDLLGSVFSGSGLVWYGGAIGGAIGVLAWMRWRDALELRMFDMTATALALGYGIGRIGCQVSGDGDYGIRSSLPWAMGYPHGTVPTAPGVRVQPTPIYETVSMCLLAYLLWQLRDRVRPGVRVRAVPGAQRPRAVPGRVRQAQQGGLRRTDRAASREPRAGRDRRAVAGVDGTRGRLGGAKRGARQEAGTNPPACWRLRLACRDRACRDGDVSQVQRRSRDASPNVGDPSGSSQCILSGKRALMPNGRNCPTKTWTSSSAWLGARLVVRASWKQARQVLAAKRRGDGAHPFDAERFTDIGQQVICP